MTAHTIIHLLLIVSALFGLFFIFLVLKAESKNWLNRFLAIIIFLAEIWDLSIYASLKFNLTALAPFAFFATCWISVVGILMFFYLRQKLTRTTGILLTLPGAVMSIFTLLPGLIIKQSIIQHDYIQVVATGPLFYVFFCLIIGYVLLLIFNAFKAFYETEEARRLQIAYIIIGFTMAAVLGIIFNLILPAIGDFQFNALGPVFMLFLFGGAAYVAVKHYIYDYQVALSELWAFLLIMIGIIWLVNNLTVFNVILFSLLFSICFLFIRTTVSEADKKIQLQKDKESLQKLDQLKDEFLEMTEHELNTPIAIIEGKLSMILDDNIGSFNDKQKKFLKPIFKDAKRLANLSRDLNEVSQIDLGEMEIFAEKINILDLISQTVTEKRPEAQTKGLKIEIVAQEDLPKIRIDRHKIKRVLDNLTSNAIKFTKTGLIRISAERKKNELVVSISDTGVGIQKEEQELIFGKFYQANRFAEIPMEQQGTGLNLYITKNLVKLHGGRIWVESTPGHGSTFSFTIPIS